MFKKATKKNAKLRLALFGVSGSGKTMSALRIAKGIVGENGKIAVIDTERRSACKYADRFDFDVCELDKPTVNNLKLTIEKAKDYDVLIVDSLTHSWLELIAEVEQLAKAKFGGNTWSAWSEGTPKQLSLINSLLDFKGHIIATMRVETNWTTITNDKGKVVPVRVGEAPKQGKGIEYEFDMLMQLSQEHNALVIKDRTGKYQDEIIELPDENFGKTLAEWLNEIPEEAEPTMEEIAEKVLECQSVQELTKFFKEIKNMSEDIKNLFTSRKEFLLNASNNQS